MLAALGFGVVGTFLAIFALTFEFMVVRKTRLYASEFALAYGFLAIAFWVWAIAAAFNNIGYLQVSVILGDALILAASLTLLDLLLHLSKYRSLWLFVATAICLYLLLERMSLYPPSAYMDGGILIFNGQTAVNVILGLIVAGIWLPVSVMIGRELAVEIRQSHLWVMFAGIYACGMVGALLFASAHRLPLVICAFVVLGLSFIMLITSNIVVSKEIARLHGRGHRGKAHV